MIMLDKVFDEMLNTLDKISVKGEEDAARMLWLFDIVRKLKGMVKVETREIKEESCDEGTDT